MIEELLGVWVRAAQAEADPESGLAPADALARRRLGVRTRPEIALSSALIRAAGDDGIDLDVTCFLDETVDPASPGGVVSWDVPRTVSGEYVGFVRVDGQFWHDFALLLRSYWNRALGDRPSAPRFAPPAATDPAFLDEWLRAQTAAVRRHSRPIQRKAAPPTRFPRPPFVIVCDPDAGTYKLRARGVSPGVRLAGKNARIMEAIVKATEAAGIRLPAVPRDLDVGRVQKAWTGTPVALGYQELAAFCDSPRAETRGKEFAEVVSELSPGSTLDTTARARIRRQVKRFNGVWATAWGQSHRGAGRDAGVVLAPLEKGVWSLQTPVLIGRDRTP